MMNDNFFEILTDPNPTLRMPTNKVVNFDMELQETVDKMIKTMRHANGVGLAAPQVGILNNIIVLEYQPTKDDKDEQNHAFPLTVVINPQIVQVSKEKVSMVEGCLSFPELKSSVMRPKKVVVTGHDRYGKTIKINADKLCSRVLQHEIDHLKGILLVDRISKIKTVLISNMELGLPTLKALNTNPQFDLQALVCTDKTDIKHSLIDIRLEAKKLKIQNIIWNSPENVYKKLTELRPELIIVAGFGKKIPNQILNLPKYGCLNIHPSLLPKHRGPSPIQATILNGDKQTGVSIIKMTDTIDAGPVLGQIMVNLKQKENYHFLLENLAVFGADLLVDLIPHYIAGEIEPFNQDELKASYTRIFQKEDGEIKSQDAPTVIDRKIRAFHHWPIAYTFSDELRVQLLDSELNEDNKLVLKTVKPAGKNVMSYQDFKRGYKKPLKNLTGKLA